MPNRRRVNLEDGPRTTWPFTRWFDESKAYFPDFRHRALYHHTAGIFLAERIYGVSVINSDKKVVPVCYLGEQYIREDLGSDAPGLAHEPQAIPWRYGRKLDVEAENEESRSLQASINRAGDMRAVEEK